MKKVIVLITTLLFASTATAENEAVYDPETGLVEIPVLTVKGQPDKFSVSMQENETENLSFTVTDAIPYPSGDNSTNEATYDPETGIAIIPELMDSGDGNLTERIFTLKLQQSEELSCEVSQRQENSNTGVISDENISNVKHHYRKLPHILNVTIYIDGTTFCRKLDISSYPPNYIVLGPCG